jgi:hypothetical protein
VLTIERKPPEPYEYRSKPNKKRAVGLEMGNPRSKRLLVWISTGAQHERPGQSREARRDMHWTRAGKIEYAQLVQPPAGIPFGICQDVVNKRSPAEQEEHRGPKASTLKHRSCQNHRGCRDKRKAKAGIKDIGYVTVCERRIAQSIV